MSGPARAGPPTDLRAYALFAGLLSMAGLPLYLHAPKFYVDSYGLSLSAMALALFFLRLIDMVQDPLLGMLSHLARARRGALVGAGLALTSIGMIGLFAVAPPLPPIWWFGAMLFAVFTGFSVLTINFYAQGIAAGAALPGQGHLRLARWRETGALVGVCLAALAPSLLGTIMGAPFTGFAIAFALCALLAGLAMRAQWRGGALALTEGFRPVLRDARARLLLVIALINAAPVAVSSTLFLFFVESRLEAAGAEGPLLLVFFLGAALAAPLWGFAAERLGAGRVLAAAMLLAIAVFAFALTLGPGDVLIFALVCALSGATMAADLTLLPAIFAARVAETAPGGSAAFALWSFVGKLALALAAIVVFPLLDAAGFAAGAENSAAALLWLSLLYAGLPCALKVLAAALLIAARLDRQRT